MSNGLEHPIGPMGWVVPGVDDPWTKLESERRYQEQAAKHSPAIYQARSAKPFVSTVIEAAWNSFQEQRGRFEGSCDLTLIDEFVFGKSFTWLPQDIGSCVWSNTFRRVFDRMLVEICLRGDPEEFIGRDEFSVNSIAPFCVSYGFARERAKMKGGDGLYCGPMAQSLALDGLVLCSTPKLRELMDKAGATTDKDYPEPRSTRLYRQIGDWAWNAALRPYTSCKVVEVPSVKSIDEHVDLAKALKPMFQCSSIAIKAVKKHKDGFMMHAKNNADRWDHNMGWAGFFIASDGQRIHRLCNTSWLPPNEPNREKYIYNIPEEELDSWYTKKLVDTCAIGEIDGIPSTLPTG